MGNIIINAIGILLLIWLSIFLYYKFNPKAFDNALRKQMEKSRDMMKKESVLGKRLTITRENGDPANVIVYNPHLREKTPVIFVLHGSQFVDGDADQLDSFCDRMKDEWRSCIVNINYAKIDKHPIPYPQEEIRDIVLYFALHASEFNIDIHKNAIVGFTGGALLAVGAAVFLKEKGFEVKGIVEVDPFLDDSMIKLTMINAHPSPIAIISSEFNPTKDRIETYKEYLDKAGIEYTHKEYPDTHYDFLEKNNPEFTEKQVFQKDEAISEEQAEIARACEMHLKGILDGFYTVNQ